MDVRDVTGKAPVHIRSDATVAEAAQLMDRFGVGAVMVIDPGPGGPVGIVTDRDLVVRGVARRAPTDARVDSMMSTDVVSIDAGDDIRQAYKLFASYPFRRLPVVDGEEFVGMLTVDDLLVYLTCSLESLAGELGELTHSVSTQLTMARPAPSLPVPAGTA
jgi:CBS domain-containing protein